jgi:hypothetical protein
MYNDNFKKAFAESMDERMVFPFINVSDYQFPKRFERKMQNLFKHPRSYIIVRNKPIPLRKILISAIVSLLILVLSFTTVAYWEEIKSFFMEIFSDHTRVTHITVEEDNSPEVIESIYIPNYIPEGFILIDSESNIHQTYFYYESGSGYITFEQYTKIVIANVNSELSDVELIDINGYDGYYLKLGDEINLTWITEDYVFIIWGTISKDEVVKIAASVSRAE